MPGSIKHNRQHCYAAALTSAAARSVSPWMCFLLILLQLCWVPEAFARDRQNRLLGKFRYTRTARLPLDREPDEADFMAIRLDSDFYANIGDLSNDLRIINQQGKSISFVLSKVTGGMNITSQQQLSGRIIREQSLPDGSFAIDFELASGNVAVSAVELAGLQTASGNKLSIAISDGRNWQTVIGPMLLSDVRQWPEITARVFPLPQTCHGRIVRIILHQGKYSKLEAVRVYTPTVKRQPETAIQSDYLISEYARSIEEKTLTVDYFSDNMPLTQLRFNTSRSFFLARVTVMGSNDRKNWSPITNGVIRRIDLDNLDVVDFSESRCKYMQIKIDCDPAGQMLDDLTISARGNVYEWIMPSNPATRQNLTVYYGASAPIPVPPQNRDVIASGNSGCFYELSPRQPNPLYKTGVQDRRNWRYLAGALLILTGGIVMLVIMHKLKNNPNVLPAD